MRRLAVTASVLATMIFASASVHATEAGDEERTSGYIGPLTAGIGAGVVGGGAAILVAAEDDDVTIGGSVVAAFGTGGIMAGVAYWMYGDLSAEEQEDKIHQGGVALTTIGTGMSLVGGTLILSSFADASDVDKSGRNAGYVAAAGGGAALIAGLIMYGVGGSPPEPEAAGWHIDVDPGGTGVTLRF